MNKTQQQIIFVLEKLTPRFKERSIPIGWILSDIKKSQFGIEQELDILEKQGFVEFQKVNNSIIGIYLKREGSEAYLAYAQNQNK
ncbi:hypothetical protein [Paenibacillus sp. FSL H7-0331]|uniref:hypothetical protein n=1 Tax=Paenibacillus sp. FSL H7-0331 TaxID=1920421 RepID=UPI00117E944B|nr:hypothetical protein [Paenibacillus sp. FSL H7-0331]